MGNVAVVGAQWGDEGKGKIVDWLSERADLVVRFQGGHNAGHTLVVDDVTYKLSLLPSGVVRGTPSIIGNGVVIDPWALMAEIESLRQQGIGVSTQTLSIADNAALILPLHGELDGFREESSGSRLGTTRRGIGPAYEDKVARRSLRVCDLENVADLERSVNTMLVHHDALRRGHGQVPIQRQKLIDDLMKLAPEILPYAKPVWRQLISAWRRGDRILFEGAQGAMLDVDHGTYPFVTSSNTLPGQISVGSGIPAAAVSYVLGIAKAYTTRVGEGPFPTELYDDVGSTLGERGREFGTVTGRRRRCGWFDAVMVRQAAKIGGINGIALTKLDVLDGLESLKICVSYRAGSDDFDYVPSVTSVQAALEPVYETMEGWSGNTCNARCQEELPDAAISYIRRIEELIEVPVALISTSPERKDTILVQDPFED